MYGYAKSEFSRQEQVDESGKVTGHFYYPHKELACYYCIVNGTDTSIKNVTDKIKIMAYYNALAREKNDLVKVSDYANGSKTQK